MISVSEALASVLDSVEPLAAERVGLFEAVGRTLAEDVVSSRDVQGYANSAMDGYAVRHADVAACPARLRVVGTIAAGVAALPPVGAGEAVKITTGGALPPGADTVIRVEDTDAGSDEVEIRASGPPGNNVRQPGEDIRVGETVLVRGSRLNPAAIGVAASVGRTLLLVTRRPRVAIVSTGNELVEADGTVAPGQVVNSNAYVLAAAVAEAGGIAVPLPIAGDTPGAIRAAFVEAARADVILSTGGVSVGEFDYVKAVMDELGVERRFWRVAQKPGKPLTFGLLGGRPYFGLPGNPVSALVCFLVYARPALLRMAGGSSVHLPTTTARMAHDLKKADGLVEFVRCRLELRDGVRTATSTGTQSSAVLTSMSRADGLIVGPAHEHALLAGQTVRVIVLGGEPPAAEPTVLPEHGERTKGAVRN